MTSDTVAKPTTSAAMATVRTAGARRRMKKFMTGIPDLGVDPGERGIVHLDIASIPAFGKLMVRASA